MDHKKKYHGGLLVFFSLLLVFLLGNCSLCFAKTTLTDDEASYVFNYLFTNNYSTSINNNSFFNMYGYSGLSATRPNSSSLTAFKNYFNSNNDLDFNINNLILYGYTWYVDTGNGNFDGAINYGNFNNTFGTDDMPYLYLDFSDFSNNGHIKLYCIDDNKNSVSHEIRQLGFHYYSNTNTFEPYALTSYNIPATGKDYYLKVNSSFNNQYKNSNYILENIPGIVSFRNTGVIYSNYNFQEYYNTPRSYFLKTLFSGGGSNPTPPIPEDTGDTGQITDDNGDVTGSIDLTGIQNSLGNIDTTTQNIETNTNTIISQQQQIQEGLTTPPDMSQTEIDAEDITDNIDFGLITNNSTLSGYSNFWFTLINGLRGALTGNVRSIDITFRGDTYTISLDDFTIQLPQQLKFLLGMFSTIYFVILIVKWWKIIIDKITSGDIDEVLALNEEERYC